MIDEKNKTTREKQEKLSGQKVTRLMVKHKDSENLKKDIMEYKWGNRGITFSLFYVLIMAVVGVILFGLLGFLFTNIESGLNQNVMIGEVNLSNVTEQTYGEFNDSFTSNLDLFGLFLIFGMVGGIFFASFLMRGKWDKILIIVDILIMVMVYILAVMLSNYYETLLVASSSIITQFEGQMPKTSNFLLHLPRYVVIIGGVAMILFYSSIPKRDSESQINYEGSGGIGY